MPDTPPPENAAAPSPASGDIGRTDRFVQSPGLLGEEIDAQFVLLSIEAGNYYGLDPVGSEIWRELERKTSVAELLEALAARYPDAPRETIERDVLAFLERLRKHGLIAAAGSPPRL